MKTSYPKIILISLLYFGSTCSLIHAHDYKVVHPGLTENAIDSLSHHTISSNRDEIREGSIHEDDIPRWLAHGYDPVSGKGWSLELLELLESDTALSKAVTLWNEAVSAYRQGKYTGTGGAFHLLGRVAHLLQDMTSPSHTHSDIHLPRVLPFSEGDDFENWGKTHFNQISGLSPIVPGDGSVETFIKNLAIFTYYKTAWDGVTEEKTGAQPDSTLKSMFPSLYWNDGGWLGDSYWRIDNIGDFENWASNSWWACDSNYTEDDNGTGGVRRLKGFFYVENGGGDDGLLTPNTWEGSPNSMPLLSIWKDTLYPECVRYTMGLLKEFVEIVVPSAP